MQHDERTARSPDPGESLEAPRHGPIPVDLPDFGEPETEAAQAPPPETEPAPGPEVEPNPEPIAEPDPWTGRCDEIMNGLGGIGRELGAVTSMVSAIAKETHDMHRKYHTEFADRQKAMQEELERYREIDKNRIFDPILTELAQLYCNNIAVVDLIDDPALKKRVKYMFLDMLQLMEANGAQIQQSAAGDKRNPRYCQVSDRLPTTDSALHDTVANSRTPGFYVENRPLIKEMIDVYVYAPPAGEPEGTN